MKVKFVTDNGVHVFVDVNGDDTFLDYDSLSEGEKALYIYLMLDLLNTLSGFGVLIIDELSVLDNETFSSLLDIIIEHQDDYDQIFIAMVNHDDTIQIIKDKGLNVTEIH